MFESIKGYLTILNQNSEPIKEDGTESEKPVSNEEVTTRDPALSSVKATIKQRLNQAFNWTSHIYEKALESGEKSTQILASHVQNQLNTVNIKSVVDKVPLLREFQQTQAEFEAEQRAKNPELNETNSQSDSICLPWHPDYCGLTDPAAVADLQTKILALSQSPNTFLLAPPAEAQLGTTASTLSPEQWQLAKLMLKEDPNLDRMRYKLVPSRISEDLFWRNYFYRINLLCQSAHLAAVAGAGGGDVPLSDGIHDHGNFVYIEENYDTAPTTADDTKDDQPAADSPESQNPGGDKVPSKLTKKKKGKQPVASISKVSANNGNNVPSSNATTDQSGPAQRDAAKTDPIPNMDELLDAELAREVDELVLVSSDDPLTDQLDRELEMELLAEMDQKTD